MHKNLYSGIKVIDMTNNFAGPMASALLADYDAEVIHIEKPITGDDNRFFMPMVDGTSFSHMSSNRGKKSLVLDLKDPAAYCDDLQEDGTGGSADILVESYRPGVMDRLGLGHETLYSHSTPASSTAPSPPTARSAPTLSAPATTSSPRPSPASCT